jgi:hypothetical protein
LWSTNLDHGGHGDASLQAAAYGMLLGRASKTYGRERLEAACRRALDIGARSYSSVNSILQNNLDRRRPAMPADGPTITHDNIRGPTYFHSGDDD